MTVKNKIMKTHFVFPLTIALLTLAMLLLTGDMLFAQPSLPMGPSQAPIDGGLSLVAAGGAAYAWKKLKRRKQD